MSQKYGKRIWELLRAAKSGDFSKMELRKEDFTWNGLQGLNTVAHLAAMNGNLFSIPEEFRTTEMLEQKNANGETVLEASRRKVRKGMATESLIKHEDIETWLESLFDPKS